MMMMDDVLIPAPTEVMQAPLALTNSDDEETTLEDSLHEVDVEWVPGSAYQVLRGATFIWEFAGLSAR